ncbi:hypothetical protein DESC_240073 [Desulfosarcina cetonica]|nr:hypothetical protein DESC_240073 [Desulfosarcina cetonica]
MTAHADDTISRLSSAMIEGAGAYDMLGSVIDVAETRPENPTEAQLIAILAMVREGMIVARSRLQGLSIVGGSALGNLIQDAIDGKGTADE